MAAVMGCSTSGQTTAADRMREHATDQQAEVNQQKQFADNWEDGNNLVNEGVRDVEEGTDKVSEGEESIKEGNAQIDQGERKIEQGREKMKTAKQGFEESNPGVGVAAH